jgi:aspartate aminotransferase-like enzyme
MTKLLYAPGPVKIPDKIKWAMLSDPPYFTTLDFQRLIYKIQSKMSTFFGSPNPVLIGSGSGTLGMEMVVQNFFSEGDNVIVLENGKYGENWAKICMQYKLNVLTVSEEMGIPINPDNIESILKSRSIDIKGLFVTHVETTTGVVNPISQIRKMVYNFSPRTLMCVDAVSSFLTEDFHIPNYDVVITASQKALQLPPGLFMMFTSHEALAAAKKSKFPKFYFNVIEENIRMSKNMTTFTPASTLFVGLITVLDEIEKLGGPSSVISNTKKTAKAVRDILRTKYTIAGNEPNGVTAFYVDGSNSVAEYLEHTYNIVIGRGLRKWNNQALRMMHFGWDLDIEEATKVACSVSCCTTPYP